MTMTPGGSTCHCRVTLLSHDQVVSRGIEASYAGGRDGREVTDRFFPGVPKLLSPRGTFYLIVIKENKQGETLLLHCISMKQFVTVCVSVPSYLSVSHVWG